MRPPWIRRESTSRPRLSVPSQKPGSAPCTQNGGSRSSIKSCASGSCGATSGAKIAAASATSSQPPASQMRALVERMASRASAIAQPRIEQRVHHVDGEIDKHEDERKGKHDTLDQ